MHDKIEMMKKILYTILLTLSAIIVTVPAKTAEPLFSYPIPPDSMQYLQQRCDYIISRFWDRCNFDRAIREPERFNTDFGAWVNIMPHASSDTVFTAIDNLLGRFAKKNGDITLRLAQMAENWLYSDTSELISEELVLPFARAAASHRKIDKQEKAHFRKLLQILESSMEGATVPDIEYILPDKSKGKLQNVPSGSILMIFTEPREAVSSMARLRLDTDPNTRALIESGQLHIINIFPGEPTEEWFKDAAEYPSSWLNVAMPEASEYFRISSLPEFYFLNSERKILKKGLTLDYLLGAFRVTNESRHKK